MYLMGNLFTISRIYYSNRIYATACDSCVRMVSMPLACRMRVVDRSFAVLPYGGKASCLGMTCRRWKPFSTVFNNEKEKKDKIFKMIFSFLLFVDFVEKCGKNVVACHRRQQQLTPFSTFVLPLATIISVVFQHHVHFCFHMVLLKLPKWQLATASFVENLLTNGFFFNRFFLFNNPVFSFDSFCLKVVNLLLPIMLHWVNDKMLIISGRWL